MQKPIRVLCVFSTLDRGGAESMCMNLYRHIDRSKVQFDFVKHTPGKCAFDDEILSLGGRIYSAPRYRIYNHIQYAKWWRDFLKQHTEYQIIHGHYFTISAIYFEVAKKLNRITVSHSHCTKPSENGLDRIKQVIANIFISQIHKFSDYCFACSQPAGEWIFAKKPFTIFNNSIDSGKYKFDQTVREKVREELGLNNKFVIGTVGRIVFQKNPLGIIDIFSEVYKENENALLLWVGTFETEMGQKAMQYAEKLGVKDKIVFTGVVNNVHELAQAMDVFILPSFYEGLPVVAIEAQAAGLRCFISDSVTKECDITGRCKFLPLNALTTWTESICNCDSSHIDTTQQIINAGYDIHQTAAWLEDFYYSII